MTTPKTKTYASDFLDEPENLRIIVLISYLRRSLVQCLIYQVFNTGIMQHYFAVLNSIKLLPKLADTNEAMANCCYRHG